MVIFGMKKRGAKGWTEKLKRRRNENEYGKNGRRRKGQYREGNGEECKGRD